ncbi:L-lactate permease [Planosporangium sp. 12N6]|uniref:L-lactate permease n=1 Tax=Planosporangium spinosum TaxID=3402278 RepID=UPI003CF8AA86
MNPLTVRPSRWYTAWKGFQARYRDRRRPRAANGSGGVPAKMISPQNLAIGAASIDRVGEEGTVFRAVSGWSVLLLFALCTLVYLQSTPVLGWVVP